MTSMETTAKIIHEIIVLFIILYPQSVSGTTFKSNNLIFLTAFAV